MHNDHHKMAYTPNEMPDFNLHMYTCRHRGYYRYSVVRRYEIYSMFMLHKKNLTSEYSEWAKHCLCHKNIKFISLSQHVMILYILLYAKTTTTSELEQFSVDFTSLLLATFQLRFDKVWLPCNALARNDVITILTSEDMENMP